MHADQAQKQTDSFTTKETALTNKINELTSELTRTKRLVEKYSQEIEAIKTKIRETLAQMSMLEAQQQKDKFALAEARNLAAKAVREHSDTALSLTKANSEKDSLNKQLRELRLTHQRQLSELVEKMITQPVAMGASVGAASFTPNYLSSSRRASGSTSPALAASVASLTSIGSQNDDDKFDDAASTPGSASTPAGAPAAGTGMGNK